MACAEIEELILNYPELERGERELVEAHASGCEDCREYLEAARQLDAALAREVKAPARLHTAVLTAVAPRPSYLPEVFDFLGWAAMVTVAVGLFREFLATYWN